MIVGVLGGIGAGKSTVVELFEECGATVVDADREAHRALETPAVRRALREWLGDTVFGADGSVNRAEVARRVFGDAASLRRLEELIHPPVLSVVEERIREFRRDATPGRVLVLDVPLLAGTPLEDACDALVFVDAPLAVRRERVRHRGWSAEELERRESFQLPVSEKRALADHVLDNSGTLEETRRQVRSCYEQLLAANGGSPAHVRAGDMTAQNSKEKR